MKKLDINYIKEYFDGKDNQFYERVELPHFNKYCKRDEEVIDSFKNAAKKRAPELSKLWKQKWASFTPREREELIAKQVSGRSGSTPKFVSGKYHSKKNNLPITFQSSYELLKLIEWEKDSTIQSYGRCDFFLHYEHEGKLKKYFPDYFTKSNNKITIVEIKPKALLLDSMVVIKLNHLQRYCIDNGLDMVVITENSLNSNIQWENEPIIFYRDDHKKRFKASLQVISTIKGIK